jgi:hypothetical protein
MTCAFNKRAAGFQIGGVLAFDVGVKLWVRVEGVI